MRLRIGPAALGALLGAVLTSACGDEPSSRGEAGRPFSPPPGWTTYRDEPRGYEVSFPSDWHRARSSLTGLVDPREILSVATYPLRRRFPLGSGRCPALASPAPVLDDFGPRDAIVSIQERGSRRRGGFPARQRPLRLPPLDLHPEGGLACARSRTDWIAFHPFRDAGRNFYAFAAMGRSASPQSRRELRRVLESLQFEPGGLRRGAQRGYEIRLPEGWQAAERNIVPRITDPRQVVAFGTYPLRYRPTDCEAFAGSAREDLAPRDVLGVVMERGFDREGEWLEFTPRPARFGPTDPRSAEPGCGDRPGTTSDWIPFTDAGRHLYALLVFGSAVTDERRARAYRTLDSLRLDPTVRPDWRSSP